MTTGHPGPLPDPEPERVSSVEFLQRPDLWPRHPVLPLKRTDAGGAIEHAFLRDGGGPVVHQENIYALDARLVRWHDETDRWATWDEALQGVPCTPYTTFEQLLAAGWEID